MKRLLALFLCSIVLLSCTACSGREIKDISCRDVIDAYHAAGYEVFHKETATEEWACYVRVNDKNSDDYIFFHFFDSAQSAEEYAESRQWNVLLWFFSLIYSDSHWLTTKTYGNIEYEYRDKDLIKPFEELIK